MAQTTSESHRRWAGPQGGPARIPAILPELEGFEPDLGGLQVPDGIVAGAGAIAHGVIVHGGDIDGGEITGAPQSGELDGLPTVGVHAVASFVRNQ